MVEAVKLKGCFGLIGKVFFFSPYLFIIILAAIVGDVLVECASVEYAKFLLRPSMNDGWKNCLLITKTSQKNKVKY